MKAQFEIGQEVKCIIQGAEKIGTVNNLNPTIIGLKKGGNVRVVNDGEKTFFWEIEISKINTI